MRCPLVHSSRAAFPSSILVLFGWSPHHHMSLSGPISQVEDADLQPARYPGILRLTVSLAKGLWHLASAFLPAGLAPHRPLIHLTQQEALKLPFQWPSPACCGL